MRCLQNDNYDNKSSAVIPMKLEEQLFILKERKYNESI